MKFTFYLLITFFIATSVCGQQLGDYKYIIVPEQFQFLNEPNKYGLNKATKQQLNNYGFKTFLITDALPFNVKENICNILNLKIENNSNFFRTKIKIKLEDCEGKVVFVSNEGDSKEKEYQRTYQEAFREALLSFKGVVLKKEKSGRNPKETQVVSTESPKTKKGIVKKQPKKEIKVNNSRKVVASKPRSLSVNGSIRYSSIDGSYIVIQKGNILTFFEGEINIGDVDAIANTNFPVETSEFTGVGYFNDGFLFVERLIKGVGKVKMKFIKE